MEWLKNICLIPIRMGLDKTNIMAMNLITMLFNIYGKKILKTESDEIINYHECVDDFNIFHLHPLYFKEIEYNFFSNNLKINNGIIKGLSIEFPWKSILYDATKIKVNDIQIETCLLDFSSNMTKSLFESHNSYLENDIEKNSEITDVYCGIDDILKKYLSGITVEISCIKFVLLNHFVVYLKDCRYHNNCLKINNLTILSFDEEKILSQIENIQINKEQDEFNLSTSKIIISSNIIEYLPIIKIIPDSNKTNSINFKIILNISELVFDKLTLKNNITEINIGRQFEVFVKDLSYISINDILLINFNKDQINSENLIIIYENECIFNTQIKCKISNLKLLKTWMTETKDILKNVKNKLIFNETKTSSKKYHLTNLKLLFLYNDDVWKIQIKNIFFDKLIIIQNINYSHQYIVCECEKIIIDKDIYKIINIFAKSQEFTSKSKMITINILSGVNINVFDLECNGMVPLTKYITTIIDLFTNNASKNEIENKSENKISFHNSKIYHNYMEINYVFIINTTNISLTNKYAQDVSIDLLIDNYLVSKLDATKISSENLEIKSIKVFLDVNMVDIIANLLGCLIPENNNLHTSQNLSEDILDKLQNALENTMISKNINCLENETNEITKVIMENNNKSNIETPIIKILSDSLINLDTLLLYEYTGHDKNNQTKKELTIESSHVYLYHKLSNYNTKNISSPFMCLILKNIKGIYTENNSNENITQNYKFSSEKIAIVDVNSRDPCWKYFLKFNGTYAIMLNASKYSDTIKIDININPFSLNIREETLIKLLAFFSNVTIKTVNNTSIFIEKFTINEINAKINYYPIMLEKIDAGTNNLFIKNYNLVVPTYSLKNIDGFDKLGSLIKNNLEKVINPNNVIQFVPNIKLVKPYAMPINNLILMISKYFNSSSNRRKLRKITKNINNNTTTLSNLMLLKLKNIFYGTN
ncbi:hypothetical protein H012_gp727 [Acanthamoeba polyphaga moumouvirus]|uniref:Chorein N-terminal domain-containing protein n=1 Tax=Acanthamoeba polyphaga moumouvirus TaxID=1269028 RepID=L7RCL5_9VIRU|nr:hypothetical protein H012_gp727 [Acanthamoeba polyphaga moumouvirus]AGC01738.1 hypothetical protein Moumou_00194 [Acanthamoeba polyphaga moumouvirus]AQN68083.1 hypothetical protein [Saudi moumouvirus]